MPNGKAILAEKSDALVFKKARWTLDKLELVFALADEDIEYESLIPYPGRKNYTKAF